MGISKKNGNVVGSFPVEATDQIMLMTNKGTLIRTPVQDIRVCGRTSQGVITFRTEAKEQVISAVRIRGDMLAEEGEAAESDVVDGAAAAAAAE